MATMNNAQVSSLLLVAVSSPPPYAGDANNAPLGAGQWRLYVLAANGRLYLEDAAGDIYPVGVDNSYKPISNGNPASPTICNSRGEIIMTVFIP